jgi:YD repeat-containing protein
MIAEFRQDGFFRRHHQKDRQGEWTNIFEYDKQNDRLTAVRVERGDEVTIAKRLEYDSAGKLLRVIVPDKNREQRIAETYSYDDDGKKKKVTHLEPVDLPAGECGILIPVEGTELCYGMPGVATITSNYNLRRLPTEHLFHDSSGEFLGRIDLLYDDQGNLFEDRCIHQKLPPQITGQLNTEQLEAMRKAFSFGRRHRYDDRNRRIETSSTMPGSDRNKKTFAYNDYGDVVSEASDVSHSEYALEEHGALVTKPGSTRSHHSEILFRYQYDSRANWIEKIVEASGQIWSIERRTINYFDDAGAV